MKITEIPVVWSSQTDNTGTLGYNDLAPLPHPNGFEPCRSMLRHYSLMSRVSATLSTCHWHHLPPFNRDVFFDFKRPIFFCVYYLDLRPGDETHGWSVPRHSRVNFRWRELYCRNFHLQQWSISKLRMPSHQMLSYRLSFGRNLSWPRSLASKKKLVQIFDDCRQCSLFSFPPPGILSPAGARVHVNSWPLWRLGLGVRDRDIHTRLNHAARRRALEVQCYKDAIEQMR